MTHDRANRRRISCEARRRDGAGARSRSGCWRWPARLAFPSRYLIMTDIVRLALFALSLDLILGYAGIVSLGHAAFFGVGAYSAGLLALHGVIARAGDRAGRRRPRRRRARLSHQLPGDPGRRSDPADGDARDRAVAGSAGASGFPTSPAAPTGCRASRCSRSSACSHSTCSARPVSSIRSPCCSCCSCWRAGSCIRRSACRCARSATIRCGRPRSASPSTAA